MGTICVPAYASSNIFVAHFEEKLIFPLIEAKPSLYLRFIDLHDMDKIRRGAIRTFK